MIGTLLSLLMRLLPLLAALYIPAVCATAASTPPFPGKRWMAAVLAVAVGERIWAMFLQRRDRFSVRVDRDWTAVAVGYAYAAVMYVAAADVLLARRALPHPAAAAAGAVLYAAALALRYGAMAHLKHQWAVHVDRDVGNRSLVTTGPYRWLRHPLYAAACIEVVALPAAVMSWPALAIALAAFIPSEVCRARFEERYLRQTFGPAYDAYAARTGGLFPRFRTGVSGSAA